MVCYEVFSRGALPFYQIPDEALIAKMMAPSAASSTALLFSPPLPSVPAKLCVLFCAGVLCASAHYTNRLQIIDNTLQRDADARATFPWLAVQLAAPRWPALAANLVV